MKRPVRKRLSVPKFVKNASEKLKAFSFKPEQKPFVFEGELYSLDKWGYEKKRFNLGVQACPGLGGQPSGVYIVQASYKALEPKEKVPGVENSKAWNMTAGITEPTFKGNKPEMIK